MGPLYVNQLYVRRQEEGWYAWAAVPAEGGEAAGVVGPASTELEALRWLEELHPELVDRMVSVREIESVA